MLSNNLTIHLTIAQTLTKLVNLVMISWSLAENKIAVQHIQIKIAGYSHSDKLHEIHFGSFFCVCNHAAMWLQTVHVITNSQDCLGREATPTSSTKFPETSLFSSCSSSVAACALFCSTKSTIRTRTNMEIHCLLQQKNNREGWEKMETASNAYLSNAVFAEEKAAKGD